MEEDPGSTLREWQAPPADRWRGGTHRDESGHLGETVIAGWQP